MNISYLNDADLKATITARNRANAYILSMAPVIQEAIAALVGKVQLKTAYGAFRKDVLKVLPVLPPSQGVLARYEATNYSFRLCLQVSQHVPGTSHCVYTNQYVTLGEITNGVLEKLTPFTPACFPINITFERVKELQGEIKLHENALNTAVHNLNSVLS